MSGFSEINTPEDHKDFIMRRFIERWNRKYDKGQKEHGGRLWRKNCFPFLVDEVLDFVSYVGVLEPHLERIGTLAAQIRVDLLTRETASAYDCATKIVNLIEWGNEEGIPEEEN